MVNNIKDIGKIIKCMEKLDILNGQMEEFILETMFKIKNMDMEKYNGQMEKYIKVNGNREYNMEEAKLKE
jgi:hypothetical protein